MDTDRDTPLIFKVLTANQTRCRRGRPGLHCILCVAILLSACSTPVLADEADDFVSRACDAWKARQEEIKSVRVKWDQQAWIRAGSLGVRTEEQASAEPFPNRDITADLLEDSLIIDGRKMRTANVSIFQRRDGSPEFMRHIASFDGTDSKDLSDVSMEQGGGHHGHVFATSQHSDISSYGLAPILLYVRPLSRAFRTLIESDLHRGVGTREIDGHECTPIEDERYRYWVDASSAYVIRRRETHKAGVSFDLQIAIRYAADGDGRIAPTSWTLSKLKKGVLTDKRKASVRLFELNPTIDGKEFQLEFPPGTRGYDEKKRSWFVIEPDKSP
jgi:hypothetical protein